LINVALVDGKVTEAERNVLIRKAQEEGVDPDELEMVLEAKLYELSQKEPSFISKEVCQPLTQSAVPPPIPQDLKLTIEKKNIRKCGACGAILQTFQTTCPDCGADIREGEASVSIQRLFVALDAIESTRRDGMLDNIFSTMFSLDVVDAIAQRKMECIKNFPIPTTKEDILEFLCMAVPLSKKRKIRFWSSEDEENVVRMHNLFVPVWKSKCEQIIMKARFAMKNDSNTLKAIEQYAADLLK
jgi:hypothetical protein